MATLDTSPLPNPAHGPPLRHGDRLSQQEFHRLYLLCPPNERWELIEGVVHMASPLRRRHGRKHFQLGGLLLCYETATPGVEGYDNATLVLGDESEVQPDLLLRIVPAAGGQSRDLQGDYLGGGPELVVEIAHSSRDVDLGAKRLDYQRASVQEYLVLIVAEKRLAWFDLPAQKERAPDSDGIFRSRSLPGLWIEPAALAAGDMSRAMAVLQLGLNSEEHQQFAQRLAAALDGNSESGS